MNTYFEKRQTSLVYKFLCAFILFTFLFTVLTPPNGYAQIMPQTVLNLPVPGAMVPLSPGYNPAIIRGITIQPDNPLEFDFVIDKGDTHIKGEELKTESTKLIKYFLAALTIPEDEVWVNLSPYEEGRVIPNGLGDTEMGRDLLAQDYLLKQLTSSMMYPEDELGAEFWDRIYERAYEEFGVSEIPVNTFNKVWIVPQKAVVYEYETKAFIVESRLKVMLEIDYLAVQENVGSALVSDRDEISSQIIREIIIPETEHSTNSSSNRSVPGKLSSQIIREIILPEIEREVNEGENFAALRQIYNSMILATWYKLNLKNSLLGQVYVDKNKTKGVDTEDKQINDKIYDQYIESFKRGVFNYIREDYDPQKQEIIPRKYFSGGYDNAVLSKKVASNAEKFETVEDLYSGLGEEGIDNSDFALITAEAMEFNKDYAQKSDEIADAINAVGVDVDQAMAVSKDSRKPRNVVSAYRMGVIALAFVAQTILSYNGIDLLTTISSDMLSVSLQLPELIVLAFISNVLMIISEQKRINKRREILNTWFFQNLDEVISRKETIDLDIAHARRVLRDYAFEIGSLEEGVNEDVGQGSYSIEDMREMYFGLDEVKFLDRYRESKQKKAVAVVKKRIGDEIGRMMLEKDSWMKEDVMGDVDQAMVVSKGGRKRSMAFVYMHSVTALILVAQIIMSFQGTDLWITISSERFSRTLNLPELIVLAFMFEVLIKILDTKRIKKRIKNRTEVLNTRFFQNLDEVISRKGIIDLDIAYARMVLRDYAFEIGSLEEGVNKDTGQGSYSEEDLIEMYSGLDEVKFFNRYREEKEKKAVEVVKKIIRDEFDRMMLERNPWMGKEALSGVDQAMNVKKVAERVALGVVVALVLVPGIIGRGIVLENNKELDEEVFWINEEVSLINEEISLINEEASLINEEISLIDGEMKWSLDITANNVLLKDVSLQRRGLRNRLYVAEKELGEIKEKLNVLNVQYVEKRSYWKELFKPVTDFSIESVNRSFEYFKKGIGFGDDTKSDINSDKAMVSEVVLPAMAFVSVVLLALNVLYARKLFRAGEILQDTERKLDEVSLMLIVKKFSEYGNEFGKRNNKENIIYKPQEVIDEIVDRLGTLQSLPRFKEMMEEDSNLKESFFALFNILDIEEIAEESNMSDDEQSKVIYDELKRTTKILEGFSEDKAMVSEVVVAVVLSVMTIALKGLVLKKMLRSSEIMESVGEDLNEVLLRSIVAEFSKYGKEDGKPINQNSIIYKLQGNNEELSDSINKLWSLPEFNERLSRDPDFEKSFFAAVKNFYRAEFLEGLDMSDSRQSEVIHGELLKISDILSGFSEDQAMVSNDKKDRIEKRVYLLAGALISGLFLNLDLDEKLINSSIVDVLVSGIGAAMFTAFVWSFIEPQKENIRESLRKVNSMLHKRSIKNKGSKDQAMVNEKDEAMITVTKREDGGLVELNQQMILLKINEDILLGDLVLTEEQKVSLKGKMETLLSHSKIKEETASDQLTLLVESLAQELGVLFPDLIAPSTKSPEDQEKEWNRIVSEIDREFKVFDKTISKEEKIWIIAGAVIILVKAPFLINQFNDIGFWQRFFSIGSVVGAVLGIVSIVVASRLSKIAEFSKKRWVQKDLEEKVKIVEERFDILQDHVLSVEERKEVEKIKKVSMEFLSLPEIQGYRSSKVPSELSFIKSIDSFAKTIGVNDLEKISINRGSIKEQKAIYKRFASGLKHLADSISSDNAMVNKIPGDQQLEIRDEKVLNPGGIDLNPAMMNLQIKRDKNWVPLPISQQQIENINVEGFFPVIINITPVISLPMLLGLADEDISDDVNEIANSNDTDDPDNTNGSNDISLNLDLSPTLKQERFELERT